MMRRFYQLGLITTLLALCVVVLGAYVRLSDAGLGCPDWPGCYGHLDVPRGADQIATANAAYPERPVETAKAWKEMLHRYVAGVLGLLILGLAITAWRNRHAADQALVLPLALLGLVVFQALLGMWTVTLQLKPAVVTAHLIGGMTTLALLWWLTLRHSPHRSVGPAPSGLRPWAVLGLAIVSAQIILGGWVSTNYAALACTDFPTCQAQWWPSMDLREAFIIWRGLGVNYEFGVLDHPARVAIHMAHRLGALMVLLYIGWLVWRVVRTSYGHELRWLAAALAALLALQVTLGIGNVLMSLPLPVAVAHNGVAALLLLALVTLNHQLHPKNSKQRTV